MSKILKAILLFFSELLCTKNSFTNFKYWNLPHILSELLLKLGFVQVGTNEEAISG